MSVSLSWLAQGSRHVMRTVSWPCRQGLFSSRGKTLKFGSDQKCWYVTRSRSHVTTPRCHTPQAPRVSTPQVPRVPTPQAERSGHGAHDKRKLLLLIIPITTFCLGTWQILRLQWKLGLIDQMKRKTQQHPEPIATDILDRLEEMEYTRVLLTGHFNHTKELYMWPRTLNTADVGTHRNTEPGACIVTPFFCHELGQWVLVNRGWVPRRRMEPSTREAGQVEGDVTIVAVVRTQESRPLFAPENDSANNHWSYKDVELMAKCADTAPLFLDADATTTVHGGPIGGQTRINLRNDHLQYIFTWYALSLFTGYMFYLLWTKSSKKRKFR